MKLRNAKTQWIALGVMILAAGTFALGSAVVWAAEPSTPVTPAATPKADCCDQKAAGECKPMGMHAMKNLSEFNKILANAKALAESGDAKGAATEIVKAENLMKKGHSNMTAKMTERRALWEKLHKERLTRTETVLTEIQGLRTALADRPDAEKLSGKVEEIYKNVQLLRDEMTPKGTLTLFRNFRNEGSASPTGVTGPEGKVVPVVNEKCPVCGVKLDREKVPADLRREFKGKPVGFCGKECLAPWDKLTDEEKQAKLDKVLPPPPPKKEATFDPIPDAPDLYPDPVSIPPID